MQIVQNMRFGSIERDPYDASARSGPIACQGPHLSLGNHIIIKGNQDGPN